MLYVASRFLVRKSAGTSYRLICKMKLNNCKILVSRHYILKSLPQAIGDGGQGWGNAILYIFSSPNIRSLLLKDMATVCRKITTVLQGYRNRLDYIDLEPSSQSVLMTTQDEGRVEIATSDRAGSDPTSRV